MLYVGAYCYSFGALHGIGYIYIPITYTQTISISRNLNLVRAATPDAQQSHVLCGWYRSHVGQTTDDLHSMTCRYFRTERFVICMICMICMILAHVGWELYNLHNLGQVSCWVGSVLQLVHRSCATCRLVLRTVEGGYPNSRFSVPRLRRSGGRVALYLTRN